MSGRGSQFPKLVQHSRNGRIGLRTRVRRDTRSISSYWPFFQYWEYRYRFRYWEYRYRKNGTVQ